MKVNESAYFMDRLFSKGAFPSIRNRTPLEYRGVRSEGMSPKGNGEQ